MWGQSSLHLPPPPPLTFIFSFPPVPPSPSPSSPHPPAVPTRRYYPASEGSCLTFDVAQNWISSLIVWPSRSWSVIHAVTNWVAWQQPECVNGLLLVKCGSGKKKKKNEEEKKRTKTFILMFLYLVFQQFASLPNWGQHFSKGGIQLCKNTFYFVSLQSIIIDFDPSWDANVQRARDI